MPAPENPPDIGPALEAVFAVFRVATDAEPARIRVHPAAIPFVLSDTELIQCPGRLVE